MAGKLQELFNKYIWDTEVRGVNLENPKMPISGWALDQVLGGNISGTGRSISQNSALTLSAVYRAVSIKAGFISSLPFQVFQRSETGRVLSGHPAQRLITKAPNGKLSKVVFFDRAMQHYELLGNHFALIKRNGIGRAESIELLHPDNVTVKDTANEIIYEVKGVGLVPYYNMIHVPNLGDGIMGKSVLSYMREDASLMMDVRGYGESFFGRGGKPAGLLIPKMQTTLQQRQETKASFTEAKKQGGEVAMPFGWEYKEISVPPSDAEWVTTNDFSIATIARWFGVPTQKLGDSAVKYSNVEYMGIEFLQDTMAPIAAKFENEYTNKLFWLDSEASLYCEFNLDAYLRADSATKAEQFSKYVQNAIKTPNEIRKYNNDPELPGGDKLYIQGATVPLEMSGVKPQAVSRQSLRKKIQKQIQEGVEPQLIIEGLFGNDGKGY
jgi:HK97 family phage portal protein